MPKKESPRIHGKGPKNLQHADVRELHTLEAAELPKSKLVDLPEKLRRR